MKNNMRLALLSCSILSVLMLASCADRNGVAYTSTDGSYARSDIFKIKFPK
jgi:hypothetical protein